VIVETGTHDSLVKKGGSYKSLWDASQRKSKTGQDAAVVSNHNIM